jgi:endonuclease/exonuclease/phosphatase (EEP) superfamily protein YafD
LYAAAVVAIGLQNAVGPERWWWAGINMFLPQFLWAIPGLILLPLTIWRARAWTWVPLGAMTYVALSLMGFCWANPARAEGTPLRVMTYNVQLWQRGTIGAILAEIRRADPDILCLQDAYGATRGRVGEYLKSRHVASFGQYVIASRFPVVVSVPGDISYRGERHTYLRAQIDVRGQIVTIVSAHFVTPRDALGTLRAASLWETGVSLTKQNLSDRIIQARALANDLREIDGPIIVAGDLNAPPSSLVTRTLTDLGLVDAFSVSGRGYGYTFGHTLNIGLLGGYSFLRLDRILVSRHVKLSRTWVGGSHGSDHRPVIAQVTLQR